jgi:hypothetical protein
VPADAVIDVPEGLSTTLSDSEQADREVNKENNIDTLIIVANILFIHKPLEI